MHSRSLVVTLVAALGFAVVPAGVQAQRVFGRTPCAYGRFDCPRALESSFDRAERARERAFQRSERESQRSLMRTEARDRAVFRARETALRTRFDRDYDREIRRANALDRQAARQLYGSPRLRYRRW